MRAKPQIEHQDMEKHEIELLLNKVCEIKREGCYAPCSTLRLRETEHSYFYTIRDFFRGGAWLTLVCSRGKDCHGCPFSSHEKLLEQAQRYISPPARTLIVKIISLTRDTGHLTVLEIQKYKPWRQKFITILESVIEECAVSAPTTSIRSAVSAQTSEWAIPRHTAVGLIAQRQVVSANATPNAGTEVRDVCEVVWEERNPNLRAAKIRLHLYNMTIDNALDCVSVSLDRSETPYNYTIAVKHSCTSVFLVVAEEGAHRSCVTKALKLPAYRRIVGKALFVEQRQREQKEREQREQREQNREQRER